jgi:magnesium and cobalt exporter, CNNM family
MNEILFLLILLILSGVFSGSETALVALSLGRVEGLAKEGRNGAQALLRLKKDPTRMLITILIGNNLVNIASASLATVVATRWFGQLGPGLAVGVLTILILIFGEITPKSLATRYAERISLFIARPLLGFMRLIFPLVWVFQHFTDWVHQHAGTTSDPMVTELELINMAGHGAREGTIEQEERELIERVFSFTELTVRDVMTPHDQIFTLDGALTVADALPEVMRGPYSRILIFEKQQDEQDEVVKVLHLRDLLDMVVKGNMDALLSDISHDVEFVPQYQKINEVFATLRRRRQHLAVVVDEFGVLRGIVTLEDLIEELFGEIYDESDTAPQAIRKVSENEANVEGSMELRAVMEFFDMETSGKPTDTVNFWILDHVKRIPTAGESFTIDGLAVRVEEASRRRIKRVVLSRPQGMDEREDQ